MLKRKLLIVIACSAPLGIASAAETTTFVYDELGRLVSSSNSGGPRSGKAAVSSYDDVGNRQSHAVGVPSPPPSNAAVFSISPPNDPIIEGGIARLTVSKSGPASASMTVNYSAVAGSAGSPGDYAATSGTLTFRHWETIRFIDIPVLDDGLAEGTEAFSVALSSPSSGSSLGTSSANVIIAASSGAGGSNNPPVANPNSMSVGICLTNSVNVTANDSDPDGDGLTVTNVTASGLGDVYIASASTIGISAYGTPGTTSVTYTISDGRGGTAQSTVAITVTNGSGCN